MATETIETLIQRAGVLRLLATALPFPQAGLRADFAAAPALAELARAWGAVDDATLAAEYSRLFIGQDAVVLHETAYCSTGRSAELADISGFYLAFGFDLKDAAREAPDFLGTELEFYSLLLLKQAYARDQAWAQRERIARDAAAGFLRDHLARWVGAVRDEAHRRDGDAYPLLFDAIFAAVDGECARLAVTPAPLTTLPRDAMQDEAFVCPMAQAARAPEQPG